MSENESFLRNMQGETALNKFFFKQIFEFQICITYVMWEWQVEKLTKF